MVKYTKVALGEVDRASDNAQMLTRAKETYIERMMNVLFRATKENFELTVKDNEFLVNDRDDLRNGSMFLVSPVWSPMNDMIIYELSISVEIKEEERIKAERKFQMKRDALAKLTKEEKELLGL